MFAATSELDRAGAILTIDLDSIVGNYRLLRDTAFPAECAAVVKADAYGLGAAHVVPPLVAAGCRTFFVALLDEGIAVRQVLTKTALQNPDCGVADIYVLGGLAPGAENVFTEYRLTPVLNSLAEVDAWANYARLREDLQPAAVHVDTGMSRLGLPPNELAELAQNHARLDGVRLTLVMSHLACADEPRNPLNRRQLDAFAAARSILPPAPGSLANSSGIFLGAAYHADLVRPGVSLYGGGPVPGQPNPMAQVVRLQGKILQVREIDTPQTVGYGATHHAEKREKIATVAVGYADGYLRALSNRGSAYVGDFRVPLVGRVSMDLITFDVSGVSDDLVRPGEMIDLIGPNNPIDSLAAEADTIGYEILTSLGDRYHRVYRHSGA
jgi:alanine racemase